VLKSKKKKWVKRRDISIPLSPVKTKRKAGKSVLRSTESKTQNFLPLPYLRLALRSSVLQSSMGLDFR